MLIDTHTHLYLPEFEDGGTAAVHRALEAGVGHMMMPNVDLTTVGPMRALHAELPDVTSMAMGLHPTEVNESWRDVLAETIAEIDCNPSDYKAIGEIGIDLYWDATFREQQMQVLDEQLSVAERMNLPVIIHCRDGQEPMLEVLQGHRSLSGVMHSFGGTPKDVDDIRRVVDFYFGINGIVTFKNSKVGESLPAIGADRLLLETDSPYLAPVPHRGKRNESAYLPHVCGHIAARLERSAEEMAEITTANAKTLFHI